MTTELTEITDHLLAKIFLWLRTWPHQKTSSLPLPPTSPSADSSLTGTSCVASAASIPRPPHLGPPLNILPTRLPPLPRPACFPSLQASPSLPSPFTADGPSRTPTMVASSSLVNSNMARNSQSSRSLRCVTTCTGGMSCSPST